MKRALAATLLTALLLAGCTGERPADDADGDLIPDANETEARIIEIQKLDGTERRSVTSDPQAADSDRDGLSDLDELQRGTDPKDPDSDDDGLLDGDDEIPDDDATRDAWRNLGILEVNGTFLGELDACPPGGAQLKPFVASSDLPVADQLLDGEELRGWEVTVRTNTYRVTSNPCVPDTDNDGFMDHEEKLAGSDPRHADTDRDGVNDWGDVDPVADVYLTFRELEVSWTNESANASLVRVELDVATSSATLVAPGRSSALLNVADTRGEGQSAQVAVLMMVTDAEGRPLRLTPDERGGATLRFDLRTGTADGAQAEGDALLFEGADGSMRFRWSVERR